MRFNAIYCGDNKDILNKHIDDQSVDLVYLDPPFFSGKKYEVVWDDESELRAFQDRWKGGIKYYIEWMRERLEGCYRVLKSTGSLYVHCDYHASHYLKVMLDKIFGMNKFRNEIIWSYEGGGRSKTKNYARKHDVLLFYTKTNDYTFNMHEVLLPHTKAQLSRYQIVSDGKRYANMKGKLRELGPGKIPSDVWVDIAPLSCNSKERLGWPTQKPESLLDRVIKSSSNETDIVMDPFCGCGTAMASAYKLNRRWIGIDVSPRACRLIVERMSDLGVNISEVDIVDLPRSLEDIKQMNPFIFQNWVCEKLLATSSIKKSGDMGIDGRLKDGTPIQVKQSEGVGRNVIDNFETAIRRENKVRGIIVAFSFSKGAYEESVRAKEDELTIKLKEVSSLLG